MRRISKYISSLVFCTLAFSVQAQKVKQTTDTIKAPIFNGFTVQVDAASLVTSTLIHGDSYSMEGGIQFDFKKKLYPIVELGIAGADKVLNDIGFKTNGLFGRIGLDINLSKPKEDSKPTNNLFFAGVRLGMTKFAYDINNIVITDNYWGGTKTFNYTGQKSTKFWYEIVAGVKVEVTKNVYMGWTVRNKNLIGEDVAGQPNPWYIPGFGKNASSHWAANYTIGYKF